MKASLVAVVTISLLALIVYQLASERASEKRRRSTIMFLDDISDGSFLGAFATEPACNGLSLTKWSDQSSAQMKTPVQSGLKSGQWGVQYVHMPNGSPDFVLMLNKGPDSDMRLAAENAQDAAKKVCLVVKGKGGQIK